MHHQLPSPPFPPQTSPTFNNSPPHRSRATTANNSPLPDTPIEGYQHDFSTTTTPPGPSRRRRRYNPDERLEVKAVRAIGACTHCRTKRVKCHHARANLRSMRQSVASPRRTSGVNTPGTLTSADSPIPTSSPSIVEPIDPKTAIGEYAKDLSGQGNPVPWVLRTLRPVVGAETVHLFDRPERMLGYGALPIRAAQAPEEPVAHVIDDNSIYGGQYMHNLHSGETESYRLRNETQNVQPEKARTAPYRIQKSPRQRAFGRTQRQNQASPRSSDVPSNQNFSDTSSIASYVQPQSTRGYPARPLETSNVPMQGWIQASSSNPFGSQPSMTAPYVGSTATASFNTSMPRSNDLHQQQHQQPGSQMPSYEHASESLPTEDTANVSHPSMQHLLYGFVGSEDLNAHFSQFHEPQSQTDLEWEFDLPSTPSLTTQTSNASSSSLLSASDPGTQGIDGSLTIPDYGIAFSQEKDSKEDWNWEEEMDRMFGGMSEQD